MTGAERPAAELRRLVDWESLRAEICLQNRRDLARRTAASAPAACWAARFVDDPSEACAPHLAAPALLDGPASVLPDERSIWDGFHPCLTNGPAFASIRNKPSAHPNGKFGMTPGPFDGRVRRDLETWARIPLAEHRKRSPCKTRRDRAPPA
jgi:hypothetical protein